MKIRMAKTAALSTLFVISTIVLPGCASVPNSPEAAEAVRADDGPSRQNALWGWVQAQTAPWNPLAKRAAADRQVALNAVNHAQWLAQTGQTRQAIDVYLQLAVKQPQYGSRFQLSALANALAIAWDNEDGEVIASVLWETADQIDSFQEAPKLLGEVAHVVNLDAETFNQAYSLLVPDFADIPADLQDLRQAAQNAHRQAVWAVVAAWQRGAMESTHRQATTRYLVAQSQLMPYLQPDSTLLFYLDEDLELSGRSLTRRVVQAFAMRTGLVTDRRRDFLRGEHFTYDNQELRVQ